MENWPPIKAWTSKKKIKGQTHFVAINYGLRNEIYWVNMVAVVDGLVRIALTFDELRDRSLWIPGWQDSELEKGKEQILENSLIGKRQHSYENACLHPSNDSGLSIATSTDSARPWFP